MKGSATLNGIRLHRCEGCGAIFVCEDCTEAMVNAFSLPAHRGNTNSTLYARRHIPYPGMPNVSVWLCDDCEAS